MSAVHAAIDANKSGGIPLGGWTSFENDTAPNTEWLQAGTTFDPDTYPELFLYLGGNTVPQRFDHNRPSDYEPILLPSTSATALTAPYDGEIIYTTNADVSTNIYINDTLITSPSVRSTYGHTTATFSVKKGDKFYVTVSNGTINVNGEKVRWFTHPMFIKATTTASSYTPSSAVQEIKDYTKDYVDASNSYSTTETLTGGTWIDGKPIYRKVVQSATFTTSSPYSVSIPDLDTLVDVRLKRNYDTSHPTWWTTGDGTASSNNIIIKQSTDAISIEPQSTGITINNFTGILEYTKTTD